MSHLYTILTKLCFKLYRVKTVLWYSIFFKKIGKKCLLIRPLFITPESISMGNEVYIAFNARLEGVKKYLNTNFSPDIILNDGVSIQQNIHLTCAKSINIGKNTAIAANVTITDINHPYEDIHLPIEQQEITVNSVVIGEDCKIYNNSVILPGTTIGKHCTIGANSVVSGKFRDYCVIVGSPARVIKRYCFEKQAWLKTNPKGEFL